MTTVTVRRRMHAPAASLFATLTEPALFATVRGIRGVRVLVTGDDGPVSVGTVRRVDLQGGHLVEEIVGLDVPTRFDYLIRSASVPFEHRDGRIEFLDRGDHVEAVWSSTFAFAVPGVGALVGFAAGAATRVAFRAALREIDRATALRVRRDG